MSKENKSVSDVTDKSIPTVKVQMTKIYIPVSSLQI